MTKAVQYAAYGGPEVLHVVDVPEPHAGPGQIRIAVHAAGVNGIDWKLRAGFMAGDQPLAEPTGTGVDASGVVDEVGEGVDGVSVGDEVFGSGSATYAEHAVLKAWAAKPAELSFDEAAGLPTPVETAIRILDQVGVQPGQTLLVNGASGGVGSAAVQIARTRDITVIGVAGPANQDYLTSIGAVPTTYGAGLVDRVRALAPDGVDAALDIAGSGVIPELVELTGKPDRVLSIADFGAPEHGARVSAEPVNQVAAFETAAELVGARRLHIPVQQTFTLEHAGEAQAASAAGHVVGGFVVTLP